MWQLGISIKLGIVITFKDWVAKIKTYRQITSFNYKQD